MGGNGVYQIPSRLPTGQQLVQVAWLEKFTSGRREAADLLGGRTPAQVSPEKTFKLIGAAWCSLAFRHAGGKGAGGFREVEWCCGEQI